MTDREGDPILELLIAWITFLLVFSWLPLVRLVMDGASYHWGTTHFGRTFQGNTLSGDAWLLVLKSAVLIVLLVLGSRGAGRVFRVLLAGWCLLLAADALHAFMTDPGGFEFHGDTLGIHLNLGWSVIAVTSFFALLAVYWALWRAPATSATPPLTRRNTRLLAVVLALLPAQFLLLRFGEPHGTTDAIGVLLTIAQCPLLAAALWPRRAG